MRPGDEEEGELVGTGSFRVDRVKALEKLSEFRRRDVGCVMLFARAAAAAGAKDLLIERTGRSIVLRFDGRPFSRAELGDPFAVLFDEGSGDARRRWLALGLVHAWRSSTTGVRVVSGTAEDGSLMTADGLGSEIVGKGGEPDGRTAVILELKSDDEGHWRHPAAPELIVCNPRSHLWGRLAVTVTHGAKVAGRFVPGPAGRGELKFEEDGVYGMISVPPEPAAETSLDAHIHGVYAGRLDFRERFTPVVGKVDDPALSLDASLASVVSNERRDRLEAVVRRQAEALALRVATEQTGLMAGVAEILKRDPARRELWRRRLEGPGVEARRTSGLSGLVERLFGGAARREAGELVLYGACATAWMRHVCVELGNRGREACPPKLWAAVQAAPTAFSADWRPVSFAELRAARESRRLASVEDPGAYARGESVPVWRDGGSAPFWAALGLMDVG